jgi:hypothetical protein
MPQTRGPYDESPYHPASPLMDLAQDFKSIKCIEIRESIVMLWMDDLTSYFDTKI